MASAVILEVLSVALTISFNIAELTVLSTYALEAISDPLAGLARLIIFCELSERDVVGCVYVLSVWDC